MIISDHGFTDIDQAIAEGLTWSFSKIKNFDTGHHYYPAMCFTNIAESSNPDLIPKKITDLPAVIRKWLEIR
jgi:hypothetical protein